MITLSTACGSTAGRTGGPLASRVPRTYEERQILGHLQLTSEIQTRMPSAQYPFIRPNMEVEPFLLRFGRFFEPPPPPRGVRRRKAKGCFYNAFLLAERNRNKYSYSEGVAIPYEYEDTSPCWHGWCVDRRCRVVDPDWQTGYAYFGVAFRWSYVWRNVVRAGHMGPLLDSRDLGHDLFTVEGMLQEALLPTMLMSSTVNAPDDRSAQREVCRQLVARFWKRLQDRASDSDILRLGLQGVPLDQSHPAHRLPALRR